MHMHNYEYGCLQMVFDNSTIIFIAAICIRHFYLYIWDLRVVLDNSNLDVSANWLHETILRTIQMSTGGISRLYYKFVYLQTVLDNPLSISLMDISIRQFY